MTDDEVRVENLESGEHLVEVAGLEFLLSRNGDGGFLELCVLHSVLEVDFLEVKDYVGDIFLNTGYGIEFMFNAVDLNRSDRITFE